MAPAERRHRTEAEQALLDSELKDARGEIERLEAGDTVPHDPRDWPTGKAKFLTFGSDSDEPYGEGPTAMIGPAGLEHHEDGSVSVGGKLVDNPQDYKGKPIPGGPTDPNTPQLAGERGRFKRGDQEEMSGADGHHNGKIGQGH
ncbi:MAG TPA: hypothetical protein VGY97_04910 [Solirubrobacteraceae bacterium]|jgi:hypothetical protein|nr:hypothetical protein [Solirubrobacteraceae bacterium]